MSSCNIDHSRPPFFPNSLPPRWGIGLETTSTSNNNYLLNWVILCLSQHLVVVVQRAHVFLWSEVLRGFIFLRQSNCLWRCYCQTIDHQEQSFSYKEVQFKMFCLHVKTSYPPPPPSFTGNLNETPESYSDLARISQGIETWQREAPGQSGVDGGAKNPSHKKAIDYRNLKALICATWLERCEDELNGWL